MIIIYDTHLYAPVGKCRQNSRMFDCIRKLRFDRSYSKRYSRYDPPRTGAYRRRDSRLCRRIWSRRRRMTRTARWRGIEKDSSSNPIARIDRPLNCILDYKYIRNASWWDGTCIVHSPRTRNCRCTHLKGKKITRENVSFAHFSTCIITIYNAIKNNVWDFDIAWNNYYSLIDLARSSWLCFLIYMMRNVKAICMHGSCRSKEKSCIPKRVVRETSETKIKKNKVMKAPIGLHVVPSPSYPGLHTHFANGSSCWQDALGSQMSTSKQDISARRKESYRCIIVNIILRTPFITLNFSLGKILWDAKASESSLVFRETRYYEFYEQFL